MDYYKPVFATRLDLISEFNRAGDINVLRAGVIIRGNVIGQAEACIRIEKFVDRVIGSAEPAYEFVFENNKTGYFIETKIGRCFRELIPLLGFFDSTHGYCEQLTAFLHACWLIENINCINLRLSANANSTVGVHEAESINLIIEKMRMLASENWFKRAKADRRNEAKTKAESIAKNAKDSLMLYARTMVVRVDFGYLKSAASVITIDHVYGHLDHFLRIKSWSPVFENLVSYAWSIEQGQRHGFHIHWVFYFDGSKECRDAYKAKEICELWMSTIAPGVGYAYNCNRHKANYEAEKIGIGVIDRVDGSLCGNTVKSVQYLTKASQCLRIKPRGRRVFSMGVVPVKEPSRGRPPLSLPQW